MKKIFSAITSVALTLGILSSSMVVGATQSTQDSDTAQGGTGVSSDIGDISLESTNSFGNLLSQSIDEKMDEQKKNNGFNVFSVEMSNDRTKAKVEFEALFDCTLVVGIYDESGNQMLASGSTDVLKDDKLADVTVKTNNMPEYFYVKAYLVDTDTFRPLCTVYESPNYTKEMQEFFAKTTKDFDENKVLNFDEDTTNNFAVYNKNTKLIPKSDSVNKLVSADDKNNKYIFENADDTIKDLRRNDIFSYDYNGENVLIVKVDTIQINNDRVIIEGQDTTLDEVFEHIKIDGDSDSDKAETTYDPSGCGEGVTYKGSTEDPQPQKAKTVNQMDENGFLVLNRGLKSLGSIETGGEISKSQSFDLDIKHEEKHGDTEFKASITGSLEMKIGASVKLYVSFKKQYLEVKIDYSAELKMELSATVKTTVPVGNWKFVIVAGLLISVEPSLEIDAEAKMSVSGTLSGTVGFRATLKGMENITETPKFDTKVEVEGRIFIGLSLEPGLEIVSDKVAKAGIEATVGVEVKASKSDQLISTSSQKNKVHECTFCLDGDITAKLTLKFTAELLGKYDSELNIAKLEIKITDFYFSTSEGFGFGECPNTKYKITAVVKDEDNKAVSGATITAGGKSYTTDSSGKTSFYLKEGKNTIKTKKSGYENNTSTLKVEDTNEVTKLPIKLEKSSDSSSGSGDDDIEIPEEISEPIKDVKIGASYVLAITESGDLYSWGENKYGQLGDGTTENRYEPQKIMSNVASIFINGGSTINMSNAAITENGDLYVWGNNEAGLLGDGTKENCLSPKKIMSNVASIDMCNNNSAIVTKDGKLYTWGSEQYGMLGDSLPFNYYSPTQTLTPKQILHNVKIDSVYVNSYWMAAIAKNGDLYTWGHNGSGQCGNGTITKESDVTNSVPKRILTNVSYISVGSYRNGPTGALTKDGELYMWGQNNCGQIGDGTTEDCLKPKKIMSDVVSISLGGNSTGAVKKNGDFYTWGYNGRHFSLPDDDTGDYTRNGFDTTPQKWMSGVETVCYGSQNRSVIRKNGDLYVWGSNAGGASLSNYSGNGIIGNGAGRDFWYNRGYYFVKPQFVMKNVKSISLGDVDSVITKSNKLYLWGFTNRGHFGEWKEGQSYVTLTPIQMKIKADAEETSSVSRSMAKATMQTSSSALTARSATMNSESSQSTNEETTGFIDTTVKNYTSLIPNTEYNFYLMKSKTAKNALGADNLLYITQAVSDSDGNLTVKYDTAKEYDSAEYFIVAKELIDISSAKVTTSSKLVTNYKERMITPTVKYNGKKLTEGEDYLILGDFSFRNAGNYTIKIKGIGAFTGTVNHNYTVSCDYEKTPPVNKSTITATDIIKGDTITFKGKAVGGTNPYQYRFAAKHSTDSQYTILKDYKTDSTSFVWRPTRKGTYTVLIRAKDKNGKIDSKTYTLTVHSALVNRSELSASTIEKGETVTLTAKASGGIGTYKYKFSAKHSTASSYTVLKDYSTTATKVWRPTKSGTYTVLSEIKDDTGKVNAKTYTLTVKAPLANSSTISETVISKGDTITFIGKASGGTSPYQYKFSAKYSTDSEVTVLKDYKSTATTFVWRPRKTGNYTVLIDVKDKTGKVVSKTYTLTVNTPLANNSTISATAITKGDTITFTGKASGGTNPYQYKFSARHSTASSYTVLKDYSTTATKVWRPTKSGTYTVLIDVKDYMGKVVSKTYTLKVK